MPKLGLLKLMCHHVPKSCQFSSLPLIRFVVDAVGDARLMVDAVGETGEVIVGIAIRFA